MLRLQGTGPRAADAFILRVRMRGTWLIDVRDRAPLSVISPLRGTCVVSRAGETVSAEPGELVLVHGTEVYEVAGAEAGDPARYLVLPGQHCLGPDRAPVREQLSQGLRTWGNDLDGPDEVLVGTYTSISSVAELTLGGSGLRHIRDADTQQFVPLLAAEAREDSPAQTMILDRLLDILVLRAMERTSAVGAGDELIDAALAAMWRDPAHPWTVAVLAAESRLSRSAFAAQFQQGTGKTPIAYLTELRLALAADALRDGGATLDKIAHQVGYATGFTLSQAFYRVYGIRPSQLRQRTTPR